MAQHQTGRKEQYSFSLVEWECLDRSALHIMYGRTDGWDGIGLMGNGMERDTCDYYYYTAKGSFRRLEEFFFFFFFWFSIL